MGACCSCQARAPSYYGSYIAEDDERTEIEGNEVRLKGDLGAHIHLQGSSKFVSMYSKQGMKGTNQDAMTVWENFTGDKDMVFVGVFDGHGPLGHKVSSYVRDNLPSKLSSPSKGDIGGDDDIKNDVDANGSDESQDPFYLSWKPRILAAFKNTDKALEGEASIETYCSGTTSVTAYRMGEHLIIANLGDSRAVLCSIGKNNHLVAEQLTVDLKPNIPSEAERVASYKGRVMAMQEEPNVYRIWMPDEDCPGLAMSRAFGDFCLKDFGLISTPQLFYRKLTHKDEFVVLATDGVWDVLSNDEVVAVVASTRSRSLAAKMVVETAVRAWRFKYPCAKADDCAVVCLFLNRRRPSISRTYSDAAYSGHTDAGAQRYGKSTRNDDGLDTVLNYNLREGTRNRRIVLRKFEFIES